MKRLMNKLSESSRSYCFILCCLCICLVFFIITLQKVSEPGAITAILSTIIPVLLRALSKVEGSYKKIIKDDDDGKRDSSTSERND